MTYYDELGVTATATADEIRDAHRRLARLLYQDPCHDPATRILAELQMRRLNGILEVLTNPDQRARYDESLIESRSTRLLPAPSTGLAAPDSLEWLGLWTGPRQASVALPAPSMRSISIAWRPVPGRLRGGLFLTAATIAAVAFLYLHAPGTSAPASDAASPVPSIVAARAPASAPERAVAPDSASATLAGDWLYRAAPDVAGSDAPELIELRLAADGGVLHGRFRARYRSAGGDPRTLGFQFEGQPSSDGAPLRWRGPGGAGGDITLRPLHDGRLQVGWTLWEGIDDSNVQSGAATLIRPPNLTALEGNPPERTR